MFFEFDEQDKIIAHIHLWKINNYGYVVAKIFNGEHYNTVSFTRKILGCADTILVDHKDHNKLNCRRSNLRLATSQQNNQNRLQQPNISGYKGVSKSSSSKLWRARITVGGEEILLGKFTLPTQAAAAYNRAAIKYFGEFAVLNIL